MYRDILSELELWRRHPLRKPLLLRGARQVGKSWLVREFGKTFPSVVEINFEKDQDAKVFFGGNLKVNEIIDKLSLYSGRKMVPGETLLFLDEIQECETAITALRYFKEEMPELHVIAAGSLVEFALENMGAPVGRIQFLYIYPLSFGEFLIAQGRGDLREFVKSQKSDTVIHRQILELLKTYIWVGGMPAVAKVWLDHKDPRLCQEAQDEIIDVYRQDFSKYARRRQIENVTTVFDAIPRQLGGKFKYSHVEAQTNLQPIKQALHLLEKAGIAFPAFHSSGQGVPLGASKNEKKFKVFFFDVGLAQRILGLDLKRWAVTPLKVTNAGAIAEQLVAQEYMAYAYTKSKPELYYWHREVPSSNAEVDLLFTKGDMVVPVEVKSGLKGGLKSMQAFLSSHPHSKYGLKISEGDFSSHGNVQEFPLYGVEAWVCS
jgi:predicted AAA+ superfamily ATPase